MKQWFLISFLSLFACSLNGSELSAEQLEQQIQLSHMLGQISQEEQNYRIQKVRALGVKGYYEWLRSSTSSGDKTVSNSTK